MRITSSLDVSQICSFTWRKIHIYLCLCQSRMLLQQVVCGLHGLEGGEEWSIFDTFDIPLCYARAFRLLRFYIKLTHTDLCPYCYDPPMEKPPDGLVSSCLYRLVSLYILYACRTLKRLVITLLAVRKLRTIRYSVITS